MKMTVGDAAPACYAPDALALVSKQTKPEIPPYAQAPKWLSTVECGQQFWEVAKSGGEHLSFARFSGVIIGICA